MADVNVKAVITAEDKASSVVKGFGSQLKSLGEIAGGVFALEKVISFGDEVVAAFNKSELATTELNSVIQSTGDISGVTAKQAEELAASLGQVTTFSKATTMAAEDVLLRFTNIGQDIFPQTLKATQDLATGLGTDLSSAAAIVGRALDAPANASRSLRSAQIVLNSEQQQLLKNMVDAGKGAEAQGYILDILKTKFGGLATAVGQTFGGQVQILQNNLELIKEQMGAVVAQAIGPLIDVISNFVGHNQEFVAALGLGTIAALGFGAAVITIAGAVAIAWAALGPFSIALLALSALIGTVVFGAVQRFQQQMRNTSTGFGKDSADIKNNGQNNFGATGQAASDLAKKLADIDAQMALTSRNFRESLAQIVQDAKTKIADLKKQLDDENTSFNDAQTNKADAFKTANDQMVRDHAQKVRDIQDQIIQEEQTAASSNNNRLLELQSRLAVENQDYDKQLADNATKYQADTQKATDAHAAKVNDLQTKLNAETLLLQKHADDVNSIQNVQLLDQIDLLKRSTAEQMAQFQKQKENAIASANQGTAGMLAANNDYLAGLKSSTPQFGKVGTDIGNALGNAIKDALISSWTNISIKFDEWLSNMAVDIGKNFLGPLGKIVPKDTGKNIFDSISNWIGSIGHNAEGTEDWRGGLTVVGERGPELVNLPGGTQIIPNNRTGQSGGDTYNISVNAGAFMGNPSDARRYAQIIADNLQDIAGKKNMTAAQMLGAS